MKENTTTHDSDAAAVSMGTHTHINELDIKQCRLLINTLQNSINYKIYVT